MLLCCIASYNSLIENPQCFETETKNLAGGSFTIVAEPAPGHMPRMENIFHIFSRGLSEFSKVPEGVSFPGGLLRFFEGPCGCWSCQPGQDTGTEGQLSGSDGNCAFCNCVAGRMCGMGAHLDTGRAQNQYT